MAKDQQELMREAAWKACELVEDGMVVGLGTGRTAAHAVRRIGEMVEGGMSVTGISTSEATEALAKEVGIETSSLDRHPVVDITIDGADEVDPGLELIKGLGGALLREKIIARHTKREVIVADESKAVEILGTKAPLPVEVLRFGYEATGKELTKAGCEPVLRVKEDKPFVTDSGNYIFDCRFPDGIREPEVIEMKINNIPGVVENGLFLGLARDAILAGPEGLRILRR
jgi:ribose 5-phosphate isomerase A